MKELSLYTGIGGGVLGTKLLGWRTIGYVEINDYCQKIITQRIKDGILDKAPIFSDIQVFINEGYAEAYKGMVDIITAGFPCQPFSVAGKQQGEKDHRNMWFETWECIRIIRPRYVFLENVPNLLTHKYVQRIFGDLVEGGYCMQWRCLSAAEVGAPHFRNRIWIIGFNSDCSHASRKGKSQQENIQTPERKTKEIIQNRYGWKPELDTIDVAQRFHSYDGALRILYGIPNRMDRTKALGNGQVPKVVQTVWKLANIQKQLL